MPPGAEAFVTALLNTILSQYGALVSVLVIVIWYQSKALEKERAAHDATTRELLLLTKESINSNNAVANVMAPLKEMVGRIAERTVYDRRGSP